MTFEFQNMKNYLMCYLVKLGFIQQTTLSFNIGGNEFPFPVTRSILKHRKGVLKTLMKLIKNQRIQCDEDKNTMTMFSDDGSFSNTVALTPMAIETVKTITDMKKKLQDYDESLYLVNHSDTLQFVIQKEAEGQAQLIQENFVDNQYSFLFPYIKDGLVLDIGAHMGDTAILFSSLGARQVVSYEPCPIFHDICSKNIHINKLDHTIQLHDFGVGDKKEVIQLSSETHIELSAQLEDGAFKEPLTMKIESLESVLNEFDRIDVLKIDCEGAEFPAFASVPNVLLKKINVIGMEYHDNPEPIVTKLKESGFNVEIISEEKREGFWTGILFAKQ